MKRLALALLLAGCDAGEAPKRKSAPEPAPSAAPQVLPPRWEESRAAAETLRLYYELIGARRYRDAWRLRADRERLSYDAFAANFDLYSDYRATVGTPSPPGEGGGRLFVNISVQLYGRMRDGAPFGTVGAVTMERSLEGPDRGWRVGG